MPAINDKELIKKLQNTVDDFKLKFKYLKELIDDYTGEDIHRFIPDTILPILANPDITSDEIRDEIEHFDTIDELVEAHDIDDLAKYHFVKILRILESDTNVPSEHDLQIIEDINSLNKEDAFYSNTIPDYCKRIIKIYKNRKE